MSEDDMKLDQKVGKPSWTAYAVFRVVYRLCILMALLTAAIYFDFWLTDGCPDIQKLATFPEWEQSLYSQTFWPVVFTVVLIVGWFLFRPKKHVR